MVRTLSRDTSNHFSCVVSISTDIPKAKVFQFENYWLLHDEFMQVMQYGWITTSPFTAPLVDLAKRLVAKFKNLRRVLRFWYSQLANVSKTIESNKLMLHFLGAMEEFRDLSLEEWNIRALVRDHL
jgi:hypothetical protein